MFIVGQGMQRVYELLAVLVAFFFPVSLVMWLVIDKFFATGDGEGHVVRRQTSSGGAFRGPSRQDG